MGVVSTWAAVDGAVLFAGQSALGIPAFNLRASTDLKGLTHAVSARA